MAIAWIAPLPSMFYRKNRTKYQFDSVVPANMLRSGKDMFEKCNSEKKYFWLMEGVEHCGGYFSKPKKFVMKIGTWVERVLEDEHEPSQFEQM